MYACSKDQNMASKNEEGPEQKTETKPKADGNVRAAENSVLRALGRGDSKTAFKLLMTNPETGEQMDYAESRMRWG